MSRNVNSIEDQLREDEGEVLHAYKDHLGYWTIGVGILIDKEKGGGLTQAESNYLLRNRINMKFNDLRNNLRWFEKLDPVRQGVLLNMAYQLGTPGLMKFVKFLIAMQFGKWEVAAKEMQDSLWFRQTPERAKRLQQQVLTGIWQ